MRRRIARDTAIVSALSLVVAIAPVTRANMVVNGSYEEGPAPPPTYEMQLPVGSTAVTGWVVTRAPIKIVWDAQWDAAQGMRSLGLNPTNPGGGIAQTFPTVQGVDYQVSFKMSGEPFTTPALKWMRVSAAGQQADFSFDSSNNWHWDMGWTTDTWSFTANSSSTTLEFASLMSTYSSPLIDDVSVGQATTDVPHRATGLAFALASPNPARGGAAFTFSLPAAGHASLVVTDLAGRRAASLAAGPFAAGSHSVQWAAAGAAPGVYFATLRAAGRTLARRFVLLR